MLSLLALAQPVSAAATSTARRGEYRVAADPAAGSLFVYRTRDLRRTERLDGIELASHAGTLQLPDGRLVFVDDRAGRVVAMTITAQGRPRIDRSVDIPGEDWDGALWAAADARLRYFAFSGGEGDDTTVTLVDLRTLAIHQISVSPEPDTSGSIAEVHVYLAGRPLQLVITTGGQFRTLPVARIVAGWTPPGHQRRPGGAQYPRPGGRPQRRRGLQHDGRRLRRRLDLRRDADQPTQRRLLPDPRRRPELPAPARRRRAYGLGHGRRRHGPI